jgi:peptidoglycan DL-endopeptidase CwlO
MRTAGIVAAVLLSLLGGVPAQAVEPTEPDPEATGPVLGAELDPIVDEGGTVDMRQQLNETQVAWLDAKVALDASVAHQQELIVILEGVKAKLEVQTQELGKVARAAYVSSGQSGVAAIMSAGSAKEFLDGVGLIDALATREANVITMLLETQREANATQAGIDQEIARQAELAQLMFDRNQQAELALCRAAAGTCNTNELGELSERSSYVAAAAPRNADGSWPAEYIPHDRSGYPAVQEKTVTGNPFATGYITPRTALAVTEAKNATFTLFVACYGAREDGGQHPRGRACDFAVDPNCTYCGAATGENRRYGDDLANFFVYNADRLGVLYVIWYQRIWLASTGRWKAYSGGRGDPSSNHTNHVHVSMR